MTLAGPRSPRILLLPGWRGADAAHWQSVWQRQHGYRRVEQDDWDWPRRGDWMARLEEVLLEDDAPAVLVAHGLGCQLVAAWAEHSHNAARVQAALLVAPPDTERTDMPPQLFNWRSSVRTRLPFASHVVSSANDPFCTPERAARMAADWGCTISRLGPHGHINAESGLKDWRQGHALLLNLIGRRT